MKVETKDLLNAINNLKIFIPHKSVVKCGKCFIIKVLQKGNPNKSFMQLKVIRDGINIFQIIDCVDSTEEDGVYLIPSDILDKYLGDLKGIKTLEFKKLKNSIKVKFSTGEFSISLLNIAELQKLELFMLNLPEDFKECSNFIEFKCSDLWMALKNSLGGRSEKDQKYTDASLFSYTCGELKVYTTDGKKLNTSTLDCSGDNNFNFAIHSKVINNILQILPTNDTKGKIYSYRDTILVIELGENLPVVIIQNLASCLTLLSSIRGVIENVEKNKEDYSYFKVNTDDFSRILKRSFNFISKESLGIDIEKKGEKIYFKGSLQDTGSFQDMLDIIRGDLKDVILVASPVLLYKSLPVVEEITIGLLQNYPVILESQTVKNYIMPLRG